MNGATARSWIRIPINHGIFFNQAVFLLSCSEMALSPEAVFFYRLCFSAHIAREFVARYVYKRIAIFFPDHVTWKVINLLVINAINSLYSKRQLSRMF